MTLQSYQREFIELALAAGVLRFGEFTLKSGRVSPYFFNAAQLDSGVPLAGLGRYYASAIEASGLDYDMLFGPAYKGIPLVSATAVQLAEQHGRDVPWSFNRKEEKDHGEGGLIVGRALAGRVLVVDDVISAGTAIGEAVDIVAGAGAGLAGIVVAIDRQERGRGELSAIQEVQRDHGCPVLSIVSLSDVLEHLAETAQHAEHLPALRAYREQYGVGD